MRKVELYIAEDGTSFEEEYKCKEYELKCSIDNGTLKDYLFLYDEEGIPIDIPTSIYDISLDTLDRVYYIVIKSVEAYNLLEYLSNYYGYICPDEYNVEKYNYNCAYFYDDGGEWINCKERIKQYKDKIDKLSKFLF